eukprot:jgi/Tetstr1/434479/TSEL_023571.t1
MAPSVPQKTREIHSHHFDSEVWNDFPFRKDDVIIASYGKSGTTWSQQIVGALVHQDNPAANIQDLSPWLDLRVPPKEVKIAALEAQDHRRIIKTHLPVDALRMHPDVKYIYVARDGRDIAWSMFNHYSSGNDQWYAAVNDAPGRVGPPLPRMPKDCDVMQFYQTWLEKDGYPFWSLWDSVSTWWEIRNLPNVFIMHFNELKEDLPGMMRKVAKFLEIPIQEDKWEATVEKCTFAWMKKNATSCAPLGGAFWDGGAGAFIYKGTNGRWRDMLSPQQVQEYEALAVEKLGPDCAHWLATGKMKRGMFGIDWKGLAPKVLLAGVPVLLAVLISKKM